jgi:bifunctional UDP-N-acetylglucosamine pyrophosphorylase/glucosamine-1-phosphate N-acetyltransferase
MIAHVLVATSEAGANRTLVVLGHEAAAVQQALPPGTLGVVQEPQRGTGHAVAVALAALPGDDTDAALVLYVDMPLITPQTLRALLHAHARGGHRLSLLSAVVPEPAGYGRVLRDGRGDVIGVKEHKELAPDEQAIREINCGVYCADMAWLRGAIAALPEHPDGEYYLPDLVPMAKAAGGVGALQASSPHEVQGVNTRVQLASAERLMRARINEAHMLAGVTIVDPATTYIEPGVRIGQDSIIYPNTHLRGATTIGAECAIGPDAEVSDSTVADGAHVVRSVVEGARISRGCRVGPFAHLRPGTVLADGVEIGNFAEVKNSTIGAGSVSHHVSYIGDATVGARVNVGAGTVTANYDGVRKHRTVIGDDVFVGCDSILRAPVTLGDGSYTGAGAVVLHDVPAGTTVAGVPARPLPARNSRQEDVRGMQ